MEVTIETDELRRQNLFIATPMYGAQGSGWYFNAALELERALTINGIPHRFAMLFHESLIPRARNRLADMFLRGDYTHLLFIDADIEFNPMDVLMMMAITLKSDMKVVGGSYPKKTIDWKNAITTDDPVAAEAMGGVYVLNVMPGTEGTGYQMSEPAEMRELGTGFLMIKREVLETLKPHVALYEPLDDEIKINGDNKPIYEFFKAGIDEFEGTRTYLSEDYYFCRLWRKFGGKIHLLPWVKLNHIGNHRFVGDLEKVALATTKTIEKEK